MHLFSALNYYRQKHLPEEVKLHKGMSIMKMAMKLKEQGSIETLELISFWLGVFGIEDINGYMKKSGYTKVRQ